VKRYKFTFFGLPIVLCLIFQLSEAQHFVRLTDEDRIQLSLDLIRKGIQQQDVDKALLAFGDEVTVKGKGTLSLEDIRQQLQTIFDNSGVREIFIPKPTFPRPDSRLATSNFWDFDILKPQITIIEDSAFVDCQLVLWGGEPSKQGGKPGRKSNERFIFFSPPAVPEQPPSEDYILYEGSSGRGSRSWRPVGFENLLDFLGSYGKIESESKENTSGER